MLSRDAPCTILLEYFARMSTLKSNKAKATLDAAAAGGYAVPGVCVVGVLLAPGASEANAKFDSITSRALSLLYVLARRSSHPE